MRKAGILLILLTMVFVANSAEAQGMKAAGIYFGGAVGTGHLTSQAGLFDGSAVAWKGMAGFRSKFFALEADYRDMGSIKAGGIASGLKNKTKGFQTSALLILPIGPIDIYGRGGVFFWKNKTTLGNGNLDAELSGTDFGWGGGLGFRLGSFGVRLEYEKAEISQINKPWMATIGATLAF